jgi:hypothetical protein
MGWHYGLQGPHFEISQTQEEAMKRKTWSQILIRMQLL